MTIVDGMYDYGATPIVEYEDTRVKIKFVLLETMDGDGHRWVYTYDDASNPYKYLQGKTYNYNEIVYAFCMFSKLDVGIVAGQIIPLPAFALKGINNTLSKKYSVKDLLSDISFTVGFIMPYFALAEQLSLGVISKWSVANNGAALFLAFSDSLLGDYLKEYLNRTDEGKAFLRVYNFITFAYGLKDSKEIFPLLKNLKKTGKLSSTDYEFLLSAWGTYEKTNEYKELKNQNEEEYNKITNELNQIKRYYDEFIK
ncbi:hypothetical protein [Kaistella yonginensis]|uniref:hypothetical protein n=1 Tax=Kaistella yonginensis TaxID=658267 RepID=UPI0025B43BC9|nr:hypothetical protein [Kaistella yonginensis]MDN3606391.1 hypothetical protein [Kaistella yonginensis]